MLVKMGKAKHFSTNISIKKKKRTKKGHGFGSFFKGAKRRAKSALSTGKRYGSSTMTGLKKNIFTPANMKRMKSFATEQIAPMALQQMQQYAANNETLRNSPFSTIIQNPEPFIKMGKRFLMPSTSTPPLPGPIVAEEGSGIAEGVETGLGDMVGDALGELLPMLLL